MELQPEMLFWNFLVFIYFIAKDFILSKINIGAKKTSTNHVISITVSIFISLLALYINANLMDDYSRALNSGYIKGAVTLPPFTLLFILSDIISTIITILIIIGKLGINYLKDPTIKVLFEFIRLMLLGGLFMMITSHLSLNQVIEKQSGFDYLCFKNQLIIDAAVFYYKNDRNPESLEDFTTIRVNPINKSPLIFVKKNGNSIYINDEAGNKIIEGLKDIQGLETYKNSPKYFFTIFNIDNKHLCGGSLIIPSEYQGY